MRELISNIFVLKNVVPFKLLGCGHSHFRFGNYAVCKVTLICLYALQHLINVGKPLTISFELSLSAESVSVMYVGKFYFTIISLVYNFILFL